LTGLPLAPLSKPELKSEFLSLFCCGLLKLEGVSFIGLPSIKLFALAAQYWSPPPHVEHMAYAVDAKLAVTTIRAAVIRRIPDLVIISPDFPPLLFTFDLYLLNAPCIVHERTSQERFSSLGSKQDCGLLGHCYFSANSYLTSVTTLPHSSWVSSSVCLNPADL
jgi:hypothetical protein